jgi:hypothetical protein
MAPSGFYLFGPLEEALGGKKKKKKGSEPTMKLNFSCNDDWTSNRKGHNEAAPSMSTIYTGAGRICRKVGIAFEKVFHIFLIRTVRFIF